MMQVATASSLITVPENRPGNALLEEAGLPVWSVITALQENNGEPEMTAWELGISLAVLKAALVYYEEHREAIDTAVAENRPEFSN